MSPILVSFITPHIKNLNPSLTGKNIFHKYSGASGFWSDSV